MIPGSNRFAIRDRESVAAFRRARVPRAPALLGLALPLALAGNLSANPQGAHVVHGQVGLHRPNTQTLDITNSPGATALLREDYRKGWEVDGL